MDLQPKKRLNCWSRFEKLVGSWNSSVSRVVRAFASAAVDLGLNPSRVTQMTLKLVFAASLLDAQHLRDSVKNKPASLLVVPLGKALSGLPHLGVVDV